MAYACRTQIVLALLGLFVASRAHRAAAAELPFTILDRRDIYGSSGSMCENVGAPPDEMRCIVTADYRLAGQRLLLDFGQPVALSAFANVTPPGLANERETLYALVAPDSSLDQALAEISVTEANDAGLHAEFPAIVSRYVLWRVDATYENRREGTSFWSTVTSSPNGLTDGLRFYGEPVAAPEPGGLVLLGVGMVGVALARLLYIADDGCHRGRPQLALAGRIVGKAWSVVEWISRSRLASENRPRQTRSS